MTKAVIFDFDDTLVTTLPTKILALQDTARSIYKFELESELIKLHWGKPYRDLMRILFLEANDELDNIIKNYEIIRENYHATFYEDVKETLNVLINKTRVGILTSTSRHLIMKDLELLQFPYDKFYYIQTSEDTVVHKPNPEVFKPLLIKLAETGISLNEIVYVGDNINDYLAAKGAGIQFFGITDRTTTKEEFIKNGAQLINSLKELIKFVD